jgi:hypothetical protein
VMAAECSFYRGEEEVEGRGGRTAATCR